MHSQFFRAVSPSVESFLEEFKKHKTDVRMLRALLKSNEALCQNADVKPKLMEELSTAFLRSNVPLFCLLLDFLDICTWRYPYYTPTLDRATDRHYGSILHYIISICAHRKMVRDYHKVNYHYDNDINEQAESIKRDELMLVRVLMVPGLDLNEWNDHYTPLEFAETFELNELARILRHWGAVHPSELIMS